MGADNLLQAYFDAIKRQDWEKALSAMEVLKRNDPINPQIYLRIGDVFRKLHRFREAVIAYHEAAYIFKKQGFIKKAIVICNLILKIDPYDHEALKMSNQILFSLINSGIENPEPADVQNIDAVQSEGPIEQKIFQQMPEAGSLHPDREVKHFTIFSSIDRKENQDLFDCGQLRHYLPGETIIEEGHMGDSLYYIKKGIVKVITHMLDKKVELASLKEGDIFGEVGFLTGRPRTATVFAKTETEVLEINKFILENAIEKNPSILGEIQDFYHKRVMDTIRKVKDSLTR